MLGYVLFALCLASAVFAIIAFHRSAKMLTFIPAAEQLVRKDSKVYWLVVALFVALYLVGTNLDGVLPAFGPATMISFIATSLILGWHNLRYARQHLPAFA